MNANELKNYLTELTKKYDFNDTNQKIKTFESEPIEIKVAFLGEFSSGKSTLINALLGRKLLPMFTEPTNAVITEISKGDSDELAVEFMDESGEIRLRKIEEYELADEIMKYELNKKVLIKLKKNSLLNDHLTIIDTPGVSSINDTHTDITYGYLPNIDVAFIVISVTKGSTTESLSRFLHQLPKEYLSKIYFVLNKIDGKPEKGRENIKNEFITKLSNFVDNPKIITISALEALNLIDKQDFDGYKKTSVSEILHIIQEEIPCLKTDISKKREIQFIHTVADELEINLQYKLNSLSWNTEDLDKNIKELYSEIEEGEENLRKFNTEFNEAKNKILSQVKRSIDDHVNAISLKISKDEDYEAIVNSLLQEVTSILENGIKKITSIEINTANLTVSDIFKAQVESATSNIKNIADIITDVTTLAATIWIVPSSSSTISASEAASGGGVLLAEKTASLPSKIGESAKALSKSEKFMGFLGKSVSFLGKVVKDVNPLEKIKTTVLPYFMNPVLRDTLNKKIVEKLEIIFDGIEISLSDTIEDKYQKPIKMCKETLENTRKLKKERIADIDNLKSEIERDLTTLKQISLH